MAIITENKFMVVCLILYSDTPNYSSIALTKEKIKIALAKKKGEMFEELILKILVFILTQNIVLSPKGKIKK